MSAMGSSAGQYERSSLMACTTGESPASACNTPMLRRAVVGVVGRCAVAFVLSSSYTQHVSGRLLEADAVDGDEKEWRK